MINQTPKSFPREHLLNVAGTFDDKIRQMLNVKNVNDTKISRSGSNNSETETKPVPGIRKSINKPTNAFKPPDQFREPKGQQQHWQSDLTRAPMYHQPLPQRNYYPPLTSQTYPNNYSQSQGPFNPHRYPNMMPGVSSVDGNHQHYYQNHGKQHPAQFHNGKNGKNSAPGGNQPNIASVKAEEPIYNISDIGSLLPHEIHETFSNGSTASTNEVSIARVNSFNMNLSSNFNGVASIQSIERFDRERANEMKNFTSTDLTPGLLNGERFSFEERKRLDRKDPIEFEKRLKNKPQKNRSKNRKKKKKLAKLMQKKFPNHLQKIDNPNTGKGSMLLLTSEKQEMAPMSLMEELEEGEFLGSQHEPGRNYHIFSGSRYMAANYTSPLPKYPGPRIMENEFVREDTIPFLYDSKTFFIDAANFTFPLDQ